MLKCNSLLSFNFHFHFYEPRLCYIIPIRRLSTGFASKNCSLKDELRPLYFPLLSCMDSTQYVNIECILYHNLIFLCSISSFMETLSLEAEDDSLVETYLILGLRETGKQNTGKPVVLSYLSLLLERSVQKNERLLETTSTPQLKDVITIFHGSCAPPLSIGQYIDRIFKYSCCSPACFIVAHIYIERFIQRTNVILTSLNVHRLLITGVMVAAKFVDDA